MATARANLSATVSADATQFHATMRRVGTTAKAVGARIGKSMSGATKTLARVASSAGKAAAAISAVGVAIAGATLKSAISLSAEFEQIEVTMASFLKDSDKARSILKEISEFSTVTPFETKGLQDATNLLLGAGIEAESVVDVLKEIAAVSKNTGQVSELADALAKGFAKGKFQTEELNKFLERGINLMPELAKVTGKTGEELQKAVQKGLRFDDVRQAIAAMSQEGGLFFGVLAKQSQTFNGLISTLKSNWDELLVNIGKPVRMALIPVIERATEKIQEINKIDFTGLGQRLAAGFDMERLRSLLQKSFSVAARFLGTEMIKGVAKALEFIGNAWDTWAERRAEVFSNRLKQALISVLAPFGLFAMAGDVISADKATTAGQTIADTILATLDGEDPLNVSGGIKDLQNEWSAWLDSGAKEIRRREADAPTPTPRTSTSLPKAPTGPDTKVFADSPEGRALIKGFGSAPKAFETETVSVLSDLGQELQRLAAKASGAMSDPRGAFKGLANQAIMQQERLMGIGPGTRTGLSGGPSAVGGKLGAITRSSLGGIGSGLTTGGLGEKRKVGGQKDDAATKRQIELAKSTDEHLMDIKETVGKALTVSQ